MRIHTKDFRVGPHGKFKLSEWSTKVKPFYSDKDDYKKRLADHAEELSAQQDLSTRISVIRCSSFSRRWTPAEKTAPSST